MLIVSVPKAEVEQNAGVPSTPQRWKLWHCKGMEEGGHALVVSGPVESCDEGLGGGWVYFLWICIWNCLCHGIFTDKPPSLLLCCQEAAGSCRGHTCSQPDASLSRKGEHSHPPARAELE